MTTDAVLVLAWLVLAHFVADFLLQTGAMVEDKFASGRRAWRGLLAHGSAVALCLVPAAAAWGGRGVLLVVVVSVAHVVIDRWKVRATRHAEAVALADAHRRRAAAGVPTDGLGSAWTPLPGALFLVDQLFHLVVTWAAWLVLIAPVGPLPEWVAVVNRVLVGVDPAAFHAWALGFAVGGSLVIVNVRAAALFVAVLVRPREAVSGVEPGDGREADRSKAAGASHPAAEAPASTAAPTGWRLRLGPLTATALPVLVPATSPAVPGGATAPRADGHASPERIGATIGILERLLIVTFVLANATAAIGFVIAAKTLARFKQLDDRDFAEYYLLGTLASVAVALGTALLAQAALATVP